jgi:hypothetical protein
MCSSLRRAICCPNDTHTLLDSRHTASRARRATWAIYALIRPRFLCCDFADFIRLPIASSRPSIGANSRLLPFLREWRWKNWGKPLASPADQSKHPDEPLTAQGDLEGMEHAKQANGSGHELSIGHSPSSARKKAVRKKAESPRPLRKEAGSKSKSGKLGCRYCGSNDLAPSFIKRRDRRCRKCFSKRYGSAARARKAKVKK